MKEDGSKPKPYQILNSIFISLSEFFSQHFDDEQEKSPIILNKNLDDPKYIVKIFNNATRSNDIIFYSNRKKDRKSVV